MNKNLLDCIKFYKGHEDINVEVYFKDGSMRMLGDLTIEDNHFSSSTSTFPFDQVTHAEIYLV